MKVAILSSHVKRECEEKKQQQQKQWPFLSLVVPSAGGGPWPCSGW
jgi:hypothetical protein